MMTTTITNQLTDPDGADQVTVEILVAIVADTTMEGTDTTTDIPFDHAFLLYRQIKKEAQLI
jgi:hypothetical protein